VGDKAYDSDERLWLKERGTIAVIPNKSNRRQRFSFNKSVYKKWHRIENGGFYESEP